MIESPWIMKISGYSSAISLGVAPSLTNIEIFHNVLSWSNDHRIYDRGLSSVTVGILGSGSVVLMPRPQLTHKSKSEVVKPPPPSFSFL